MAITRAICFVFFMYSFISASFSMTISTPTAPPKPEYVVPEATIELLKPKGFSVSIPMSADETLFAFHGNISTPIEHLEAGQFSKDILRAKNNRWTFNDKTTELKPGDIINYWTYVIKDGLGYRRDAQQYIVPGLEYTVPEAEIKLREPIGFSVSIPNAPGVSLFAFHGNINMPLNHLEAGQFSKDIKNMENDRWTFLDSTTQLKVGDVINYWTFVIKDGLGYRRDAQQYTVKDSDIIENERLTTTTMQPLTSTSSSNSMPSLLNDNKKPGQQTPLSASSSPPIPCENNEKVVKLRNQLSDIIEKYQNFYDRTQILEQKVESLNEVINQFIGDQKIGTKLALSGDDIPADSTMIDAVRSVIEEKLRLSDVSKTIVVAKKSRDNNSIIFEVNTPIDKLRILARANYKLKNSKIQIYDV